VLSYIFEDKNITIINIPGTPHPWFIVDEIRNALGYIRNEVLGVLNIHELRIL